MPGIAFGYVIGLARTAWWRLLLVALTVTACILLGYRPWELTWQVYHGVHDNFRILPQFPCEETLLPQGDVTKNDYTTVIVLDRSERRKQIYYIDPNGQKVPADEHSRRLYRMQPYLGSVWRIEKETGKCLPLFEVKKGGGI